MQPSTDSRATTKAADLLVDFQWKPETEAGAWVKLAMNNAMVSLPWASSFAFKLQRDAGVRLIDLLDTVFLGQESCHLPTAMQAGWVASDRPELNGQHFKGYEHPGGLFPTIAVYDDIDTEEIWLAMKVEFVADFLAANDLTRSIEGEPWSPYRYAMIENNFGKAAFAVAERHGRIGYCTSAGPDVCQAIEVYESFRTRARDFDSEDEALQYTIELVDAGIAKIGRDYACDRFFAAERDYWKKRNRAAQFQKSRQDRLGIGWANHDHHTYRSSRQHFKALVELWEKLGFYCRERFYAGIEAGWGAQVMEQPITGLITFNDVDLSPEELAGDFSHDGLVESQALQTVGLWCGLHGEAVTLAGMHHLEGTFDFVELQNQMESQAGIRTMKPFTDFPYLKQAFTEGERWPVQEKRLQMLLDKLLVTDEQADRFRKEGAIGSHLENLERNDGFKGFNQKGVSEIIAATDPRRQAAKDAFEKIDYKTVGE
ncbi:MAG: hypothetical protein SGI77_09695 [Pirellulaceae bacterium]|nr:hypothetical protein [Pirellulaceae bacterium]